VASTTWGSGLGRVFDNAEIPDFNSFADLAAWSAETNVPALKNNSFLQYSSRWKMTDTTLGNKARSAVIWNTGFNLFRDGLQFLIMIVMVRILNPESYGEFALVTSVIGFISVFSHNNFISHLLQVKTEEETCYQDHFTAGLVIQAGMFLVTNLVAIALNWSSTFAPVVPYVHVMSMVFLLEWPCELRRKMIEREFDWRRLRMLQGVGLIAGAILGPLMAWSGAGTYALLLPGLLVTLPFIYDLFITQGWRPNWDWSWQRYRPAFRFGIVRLASGLVSTGRQLLENGAITAIAGFAMLGIFGRAIGLSQMFCLKFASQLMYAIYPVLTRIGGRGDETRVSALVLQTIAWFSIPVAVVFMELSEVVVNVIYGDRWDAVTPLLPAAMLWGASAALAHGCYMLLMSHDRVRLCFVSDCLILGFTGLALFMALPRGLDIYLYALCVIQLLILSVNLLLLYSFALVSLSGLTVALLPPLCASLAAWGLSTEIRPFLQNMLENQILYSLVWSMVFLTLFLGVLRGLFSKHLAELVSYFPASDGIKRLIFLR
jgi:O-antigen/teichoic acid export membrane protein